MPALAAPPEPALPSALVLAVPPPLPPLTVNVRAPVPNDVLPVALPAALGEAEQVPAVPPIPVVYAYDAASEVIVAHCNAPD